MKNYKGKLITFEGGEGSSKTTQIGLLRKYLSENGYKDSVVDFHEPGGEEISEKIRAILLDKNHKGLDPKSELMLFMASRAQFVSKILLPKLNDGYICLLDRFYDSSVVYQGLVRGLGEQWVKELSSFVTGGLVPDLTFLLDVDPVVGLSRRAKSGEENRLDAEKLEFHKAVRLSYIYLYETDTTGRWRKIDASRGIEAIHNDICREAYSGLGLGVWRPGFEWSQISAERFF